MLKHYLSYIPRSLLIISGSAQATLYGGDPPLIVTFWTILQSEEGRFQHLEY